MNKNISLSDRIKNDADQCVRCGLCLPHCPTYQLDHNESESPRGRIAIAKALAEKKIPLSKRTKLHLDHCLGCLACEAMCPINVPYHRLLINTRELLQQKNRGDQKRNRLPILINFITRHTRVIPFLQKLLRTYQKSGLQWLFQKSSLTNVLGLLGLKKYDENLPTITSTKRWKSYYPPITRLTDNQKKSRGDVALFLGCINYLCDNATIEHAIEVLTYYGYGVIIPKKQGCCGAIHLHHGDKKNALKLMQKNVSAFTETSKISHQHQHEQDPTEINPSPIKAIISLVSGCNSTLNNYSTFLSAEKKSIHNQPIKNITDVCDFLNQEELSQSIITSKYLNSISHISTPTNIEISNRVPSKKSPATNSRNKSILNKSILIHTPCSLKNSLNSLKGENNVLALLRKLNFTQLSSCNFKHCCGGSGLHMWDHPNRSEALAQPLIDEIIEKKPDILVTSNIGCKLHLEKNLRKNDQKTLIMHPITLIFLIIKEKTAKK